MGTCHSINFNNLTREISIWCITHWVFLSTAHIPGKENEAADAEARKARDQAEWVLDPEIFQQVHRG